MQDFGDSSKEDRATSHEELTGEGAAEHSDVEGAALSRSSEDAESASNAEVDASADEQSSEEIEQSQPLDDNATPESSRALEPAHWEGRAPAIEGQRIGLIPFVDPPAADNNNRPGLGQGASRSGLKAGVAAACVALIVAAAGAATYRQVTTQVAKSQADSTQLASAVAAISARLDALDAAKPHEEAAEVRKAVTEARGGLATSKDLTATVSQLNARLDRLEHDEQARVDKLGERVDHDAAARSAETQAHSADIAARVEKLEKADVAARLDKVEKKVATAAVVPTPPVAPKEASAPAPAPSPAVSNDITGSIEKPHTPTTAIHAWTLAEMHNGAALVENRQGVREIAVGDFLPGAGRVIRFERRGHEWIVVTDQGVIEQAAMNSYGPPRMIRPPGYGPYADYGYGYGYGQD
jgi:hypothetical protein